MTSQEHSSVIPIQNGVAVFVWLFPICHYFKEHILFCNQGLNQELKTIAVFDVLRFCIKTRQKFEIYFKNEDFLQKV